jgi:hypothetical protein
MEAKQRVAARMSIERSIAGEARGPVRTENLRVGGAAIRLRLKLRGIRGHKRLRER